MNKFKKFIKDVAPYAVGAVAGVVCVASGIVIGIAMCEANDISVD